MVWWCDTKKKEFNVQSSKRLKSDKNPKDDQMQVIFELKGDEAFK